MPFLHFIGKSYYGEEEFKAEARKMGVQRRIQLNDLSKVGFGDRVFLAQGFRRRASEEGESELEPARVFGYFIVSRLAGLSPELLDIAFDLYGGDYVGEAHKEGRGCGAYMVGQTLVSNTTIPDIAKLIRDNEPDRPFFVAGKYFDISPFYLADFPFCLCRFISLDGLALRLALAEEREKMPFGMTQHRGKTYDGPVLCGRFETDKPSVGDWENLEQKEIQSFLSYEKAVT